MPGELTFLTEDDVRRVLDHAALVDAMAAALAAFSSGRAQQPLRTAMTIGPERTWLGVMPAEFPAMAAAGLKVVAVTPPRPGIEFTHQALIVLIDPPTGRPLAVMDGRYITEMRTAAVSAVAVARLASAPPKRLALIGTGVQAHSHLDILGRAGSLEEVRVWSPSERRRQAFVDEMTRDTGLQVRTTPTAEAAVRGADLIVLVTSATEPVVRDAWVAPGTLIISVGACRPTHREMDPATIARAALFVDSRDAALAESGDVVMGVAEGWFTAGHILGELGDVVSGVAVAPRDGRRVTVFKSLGMGVEDVAAATLAYRAAIAGNVGTSLPL